MIRISPPTPTELDRLRRVGEHGAYAPYTALERSAMQTLAACGWVREMYAGTWELTELGKRLVDKQEGEHHG